MSRQSELRQEIAQRVVDAIRRGVPPWRRGWRDDLTNTGSPANAVSRKSYRGVNALLLGLAGYSSRWWATFPQVQALGDRVRKGERATRVVYWQQVEQARVHAAGVEEVETFPLLRIYCVFNAEQCEGEGIERFLARPRTAAPFVNFTPAEEVIAATGARIEYGGSRAVYFPEEDFIRLPPRESFVSRHEFYATAFHELVHHSGHESRLNRIAKNARFGSQVYAFEELVAEIGGCFLSNEVGVPQSTKLENHAAYVASWLAVLEQDATATFTASSQASAAVDFILSFSREEEGGRAGDEDEGAAAEAVGRAS